MPEGRVPPQSIEAELSVLGSMMLKPAAVSQAVELLHAEDFYRQAHRAVFEAMELLLRNGEPVDIVTVTESLKKSGLLEQVGGISFLANLTNTVPSTANLAHYAKIVKEKAVLRALIDASTEIAGAAYEASEDIAEQLDDAERKILAIAGGQTTGAFISAKEVVFDAVDRVSELAQCHVLIVGLGGVGGFAAELIARAGIGRMTIVDADIVQPSNINRQLVATTETIGEAKASVLAARLRAINPHIQLEVIEAFLKDENMIELLDRHRYDYVIDAIDSLSPKVHLIAKSMERGLPIISSMGAGAKSDPTQIHQADLNKSYNCTLARALRKRLRKFGIRKGLPVVFSTELPDSNAVKEIEGEQCKRSTAGTVSYMPALFGCHLAAYVIQHIQHHPTTEPTSL